MPSARAACARHLRKSGQDCARYFHRNPYTRWFNPLDELLRRALGVSYYEDTACHLDLVQWATTPVWGQIPDRAVRDRLLGDGVEHLRRQLARDKVRIVVVNGATVWEQLDRTRLANFGPVGVPPYGDGRRTAKLITGEGEGTRFLGWSLNLQSTPGVTRQDRDRLSEWLKAETTGPTASVSSDTGHLPPTTVSSKQALHALLRNWAAHSDARTIGDVGTFGVRPLITLAVPPHKLVINADTKRSAVLAFLDHAHSRGAEAPWRVMANRTGEVNKADFAPDGTPTPGWYCYLTPPATEPFEL